MERPGETAAAGRRRWLLPVGIGVLAVVPRLASAGRFQTTDETLWISRSQVFSDALIHLEPSKASATTDGLATMPGVTTMWVGTVARVIWSMGRSIGLIDETDVFAQSTTAIALCQVVMAVACSVVLAVLVAVSMRWAGVVAAAVAGVLLATEPFVVAHGAVLHTDELTAFFGAAGVLALLVALDIPTVLTRRHRAWAVVAGVLLAGAFLTKASALTFLPGLVLVIGAWVGRDIVRARSESRSVWSSVAHRAVVLVTSLGVAAAVVFVAWPALWVTPLTQMRLLRTSASMAGDGHRTFFLGETTWTPGAFFYGVALPLRMTPWFLVAFVAAVPLALRRRTRTRFACLAALGVPMFASLSLASKQLDRYILVVVPFIALVVGLGVESALQAIRARRTVRPTQVRWIGVGACAIALTVSLAVAPYGLAYFNPLLGGSSTGESSLLVGWGEGLRDAGRIIADRQGGECGILIDVVGPRLAVMFPCGLVAVRGEFDYRVIYVSSRQRDPEATIARLRADGDLVGVVRIRGIVYAEVYDLRPN